MHPGFRAPDFSAKLDPAEFIRLAPPSATLKGVFLANLMVMARSARGQLTCVDPEKKYHAFKDYPLTEHIQVLAEVARLVHPALSHGEALRQIGQRIYPMFAASLLGKVLFSTVGHNPSSVILAGAKAYKLAASVGRVQILELDERHGHLLLEDIFNFVEQYHVGIFEGAIRVIGYAPQVFTKPRSLSASEFYVTW